MTPLLFRAAAALMAGFLALAPAAQAAPGSAVVVLPYTPFPGVAPESAARLTELVQGELRGRDELRVVELKPLPRQPAQDALGQSRAALAKAAELARRGRHAAAAESLQKAISLLSAKPAALDEAGGQLLSDAALQLAVERLESGDEDGGDAALAQLVRLSPERQVRAADYPPAFLVELASVRKRLLAEPRASLRVLAPPGSGEARLVFDGRLLPGAPLDVKNALPGEHFLRVERAGAVWASRVVLIAGVTTRIAPLPGIEGPAAELEALVLQGDVDRAVAIAAGRLAREAGAQAAVFGAVVKSGDGLAVKSFLALAKGDRVLPLATLDLDRELLGALVQMVKLGDETVAKLAAPPAEPSLPIVLSGQPESVPSIQGAPPAPAEPEMLALVPLVSEPPARQVAVPGAKVPPPAQPPPTALVPPPATTAPTDTARSVAIPSAPPPAAVPRDEQPSRALVIPRQPPADELEPTPAATPTRVALAPQVPTQALEPEQIKPVREPEQKSHTVLWIVAGALVVGGLAAGGYLLWQANQTPSSATVTTTWNH